MWLQAGARCLRRGRPSRGGLWSNARSCSSRTPSNVPVDPSKLQTKLVKKAPDAIGAYLSHAGKGYAVVNGYTDHGFKINENYVAGAVFMLPQAYFSWNVKTLDDLTDERLAVLDLLEPLPEIFVLGVGNQTAAIPRRVEELFIKRGILLDVCDTINACQMYNVLNAEGRAVACGMLTLKPEPPAE